jgi:CubicO group peptidase (beta-lactamase class C family)
MQIPSVIRYVPKPLRRVVLNSADVPNDLSTVTRIAAKDETDPELVGMTRRGVNEIWKSVENIYATGMHPAISLVIRRHGKIVLKRTIGHARGNGPGDLGEEAVPMTPNTPVGLFSSSKAIAALPVHLLSERKQLSLLDPVSHYIPEFGQNGKRGITIYQLLCHKAGIPTIRLEGGPDDLVDLLLDKKETLRVLYAAAPEKPGHHHAYHALTAGFVIADLVEKVSGQSFRSFFRQNISTPLGLTSLDFGARGRTVDRIARNYATGFKLSAPINHYARHAIGTTIEHATELSNDPRFYQAVIPAGNGVATADDASAFFQCLLNGGEFGGVRVFQPLTVRRAVAEVGKPEMDRTLLMPLRYSAGMMLGGGPVSLYGPNTSKAFGHLGFTNNVVWADPERGIATAFLATGKAALSPHLPHLIGMLYNISHHCPRLSEHEQEERLLAAGMC